MTIVNIENARKKKMNYTENRSASKITSTSDIPEQPDMGYPYPEAKPFPFKKGVTVLAAGILLTGSALAIYSGVFGNNLTTNNASEYPVKNIEVKTFPKHATYQAQKTEVNTVDVEQLTQMIHRVGKDLSVASEQIKSHYTHKIEQLKKQIQQQKSELATLKTVIFKTKQDYENKVIDLTNQNNILRSQYAELKKKDDAIKMMMADLQYENKQLKDKQTHALDLVPPAKKQRKPVQKKWVKKVTPKKVTPKKMAPKPVISAQQKLKKSIMGVTEDSVAIMTENGDVLVKRVGESVFGVTIQAIDDVNRIIKTSSGTVKF